MTLPRAGRRVGSLLAAATLVAGPLALAAPAHAETVSSRDATHDVRRWTFSDSSMSSTKAPAQRNGDLRRVTVRYGAHRIRVVETFRELDHSAPVLAVGGSIKLPSGKTHDLVVRARKGSWQGTARLAGRPDCTVTHHLRYGTNRAVIAVPADCLGAPEWIRFQADSVTTDSWTKPTYGLLDIAPGTRPTVDRYGTRIHRG